MSDLDDLYQEVIFDHHKAPRNFRVPEHPTAHKEGYNPLCGDRLTIYVEMDGERIKEIGFQGAGCAISRASASLMTESVKGMSREEVLALFERVHRMLTGEPAGEADEEDLGKLMALAGIAQFPVRVKCASLAWHTLRAALEGEEEKTVSPAVKPVSTE